MSNVQVAVRVRPFNEREKSHKSECIIQMQGPATIIRNPELEGPAAFKSFSYDYSYWSIDHSNPENYADQERVFKDLGINILDNAISGFNCSIFAYGQTGSGKSYSMLGYGEDKGLIPRVCEEMYHRIDKIVSDETQVKVEVSFMEIYNENVFDLLNPSNNKSGLKVRNHPTTGPYVEDLSRLAVNNYADIEVLMDEGSKARTVASTNMNATSSRSHAVFTIVLTITKGIGKSMVSKIHMVDLAGSERATATGASGQRLKEGANINKSLSTLGKVIAALAKKSEGKKNVFVPYRDSVLTWLLKESLGGNSKTIMLAAISPADINFEETLSTLRYADSAKQIKNAAIVNEDPTEKLIRELQEEVERLKQLLAEKEKEQLMRSSEADNSENHVENQGENHHNSHEMVLNDMQQNQLVQESISTENASIPRSNSTSDSIVPPLALNQASKASRRASMQFKDAVVGENDNLEDSITESSSINDIKSQLMQSTKLMQTLGKSWETRLAETQALQKERTEAFEVQGLFSHSKHDAMLPNLVNLNEDPLLSGSLVYYIRQGETRVGSQLGNQLGTSENNQKTSETKPQSSIILGGLGIQHEHCIIVNDGREVWLHPRTDAATFVNGIRVTVPRRLVHGCRVIIGTNHIFRFNHPAEASQQRKAEEEKESPNTSPASPKAGTASTSPISPRQIDWRFALEERAAAEVDALMANTLHFDLSSEEEKQLEKRMKEYYDQKGKELEEINKQLESLRKNRDSALDAIDYEQNKQELMTKKISIDLELTKQKEKFASFSFRVWTEKLERQQLKEAITRFVVLIDEANAISKELQKGIHYELRLRSSHPISAVPEEEFESGFGMFKKMIVEARGIDLITGRYYDWSYSSFSDLLVEMRAIYAEYLTADDDEVDKYIGRPTTSSQSNQSNQSNTPRSQTPRTSRRSLAQKSSDSMNDNSTIANTERSGSLNDYSSDLNSSTSPFHIPGQEEKLLMFSHINLRDLLYLNHTESQAPVLDLQGRICGHFQVEIDRIISEDQTTSSSSRVSFLVDENNNEASDGQNNNELSLTSVGDHLVGRDIEIVIRINKIDGLEPPLPDIFCTYEFWNSSSYKTDTVTSEETSSGAQTLNFFHEERFFISDAREDFLQYLEREPLLIEVWGTDASARLNTIQGFQLETLRKLHLMEEEEEFDKSNNSIEKSSNNTFSNNTSNNTSDSVIADGLLERKEEKFKLLASVLVQEIVSTSTARVSDYKNVSTKQEPWNTPTVLFKLRKNLRAPRRIVFQIAQIKDHPITIETCSKVCFSILPAPSSNSSFSEETSYLQPTSNSISKNIDASINSTNTVELKIVSIDSEKIEVEWDSALTDPILSALMPSAKVTGSNGPPSTPTRRRGRSVSKGGQNKEASNDQNKEAAKDLSNTSEDQEKPLVGVVEFEIKLDKLAKPVKIAKAFNMKFYSPERVRGLSRTVSEVQMIEDLNMKEVLKGEEEQMALYGSHFQVNLVQFRTVAKKISAMIEEQQNIQKLTSATLLQERFTNELNLIEKLSTLPKLEKMNKKLSAATETNQPGPDTSSSPPSTFNYHFNNAYPRTKTDIQSAISKLDSKISTLMRDHSLENSSSDISIQVSTTDINNSMESKVCGYLFKKAGKIWKQRWCVLSKMYFSVYRTEEDENPKDILDLTNARINDTTSNQYPNSFAIVNWQNVWFFQAKNPEDFKRWMEALDPERKLRETQAAKEKLLQQKLENTSKSLKEANDQIKIISREIAEAVETIQKREDEIVALTMEIEKLQIEIKDNEDKPQKINHQEEDQLIEQKNIIDEQNKTIQALKEKILSLEDEIDEQQTKIEELVKFEMKAKDLASKLLLVEEELAIKQDEVDELKTNVLKLKNEAELKEEEISTLEQEIADLKANLLKKIKDIDSKEDEIVELQDQISDLTRTVAKKEKEVEKASKHKLSHESDLEASLEETKTTITELKKQNNVLLDSVSDKDATIQSKERELQRKESQLSESKAEIESLEEKISKLQKELKNLKSKSSSTRDKSDHHENEQSNHSEESEKLHELKTQIKKLKETISTKESEIAAMEREYTKKIKDLSAELLMSSEMREFDLAKKDRDLEKKIQELSSKEALIEQQQEEIDEKKAKIEEMKKEAIKKQKLVVERQNEIEKQQRQIYNLQQDMVSLQKQFMSGQTPIQALETQSKDAKSQSETNETFSASKEALMLKKRETQLESLKTDYAKLEEQYNEKRTDLKELKKKISEISKESSKKDILLASRDRQIEEQQKSIDKLSSELSDLEKTSAEQRRTIVSQTRQISDAENLIEELKDKIEDMKMKMQDKDQEIEDKQHEIMELQNEVEMREEDAKRLEREVQNANEQIRLLDDACFDLQRKLEDTQQMHQDYINDDDRQQLIREHKKQVAQLSQDISSLESELSKNESHVGNLNKQLDKKEYKIQELEGQIEALKSKMNDLSFSASRENSSLTSLKRELNQKDQVIESQNSEIEDLKRELKRISRKMTLNETSSTVLETSSKSTQTDSIRRPRDSNPRSSRSEKSLEEENEKLKEKQILSQKEIVRLQEDVHRKQSHIERLERDRAIQKKNLEELEASMKETISPVSSTSISSQKRSDLRKIDELQMQLDEAISDAKRDAKKVARAHQLEMNAKQAEIDQLKSKVASLSTHSSSSSEKSRPKPQIVYVEAEPVTKTRDVESEREMSDLRETILKLQSQLKDKLTELEDAQFALRRGENQTRKANDRFETERAQYLERISQLEAEKQRLSMSSQRTRDTSIDHEDQPIDWKLRCQQMEREMEALRRELKTGNSVLPKYPDVHAKVLLGEVDVLKQVSGSKSVKIQELRGRQKELATEKANLKIESIELVKENLETSKTAAEYQRQAKRLQEQLESVQARYEETSRSEKKMRKENEQLLDERIALIVALKKIQLEVLAASGEPSKVHIPITYTEI